MADSRDLTRRVATVASGATAHFAVNRQGKSQDIAVKIGDRPDDKVAANNAPAPAATAPAVTGNAMGLGLAALTEQQRKQRNIAAGGVLITKVDPSSDAADKGLQAGDIVLKVGSHAVKTPAEVQAGIAEAQKGGHKSVLLLVATQGGSRFVAVDIAA